MYRKKADDDLLSDDEKPTYLDILTQKLGQSQNMILQKQKYSSQCNKKVLNRIKKNLTRRQQKIYIGFVENQFQFFSVQWKNMRDLFPQYKLQVQKFADQRIRNIYRQLRYGNLQIIQKQPISAYSYNQDMKKQSIEQLKGQSQQIKKKLIDINNNLQNIQNQLQTEKHKEQTYPTNLHSAQKQKQYNQFIKKTQQQKQQRLKKLQQQQKKYQQQYIKRLQEQKQRQQQQFQRRKQQFIKKQQEYHKQRQQQKKIRELRNSQYIRVKKILKQKPPLYQKIIHNYQQRHDYEQMKRRHRVLSQNKQRYKHIDQMNISQHQKYYEEIKKQKQQQRLKKLQQLHQQQIQSQKKSSVRYASMQLTPTDIDKELAQKQLAKQKQKKIRQYQQIVKQNFKPRINQQKRKQMLTLIEQLELNSKKLRKNKLENGSVVYEEIGQSNPREIGMKYLEKTKQMAAKAKMFRSSSAKQQKTFHQENKKKSIDYLAQMRKISQKNPHKTQRKLYSQIIGKNSNLSFDEKVNKIETQTQKLKALNKQNQMKLKFGKFGTSDEILTCTEQIDQNYLQIAKMKLRLMKQQP